MIVNKLNLLGDFLDRINFLWNVNTKMQKSCGAILNGKIILIGSDGNGQQVIFINISVKNYSLAIAL